MVDADDAADAGPLRALQLGESAVEVGAAEALLGEQGLTLRAVEAEQAIRPGLGLPIMVHAPHAASVPEPTIR